MKNGLLGIKIGIAAHIFCAIFLAIVSVLFFRANDARAWYVLFMAGVVIASAVIGGLYVRKEHIKSRFERME